MRKIVSYGPVFIIIAALLWSFDGLLRQSLYSLPPTVVVMWEHLLGAIILLPLAFKKRAEVFKMTGKEWLAIAIVSLFSGALGTILYTAALGKVNYIQFSVVVLLQQLQPIWTIIAAAILLREKLTKNFLLWAALAIVGSYLVTFKDLRINAQGSGTLIAAGMALLAGVMWGTSTSFSKIALNKISYLSATFLRFILAPLFAFIFVVIFNQTSSVVNINPKQWLTLFIITLSTGMVALLIYYYGLRSTQAKVSSICELTWPVSAIFIDFFYFGKFLSLTQVIGVFIVLFSIYKVARIKR